MNQSNTEEQKGSKKAGKEKDSSRFSEKITPVECHQQKSNFLRRKAKVKYQRGPPSAPTPPRRIQYEPVSLPPPQGPRVSSAPSPPPGFVTIQVKVPIGLSNHRLMLVNTHLGYPVQIEVPYGILPGTIIPVFIPDIAVVVPQRSPHEHQLHQHQSHQHPAFLTAHQPHGQQLSGMQSSDYQVGSDLPPFGRFSQQPNQVQHHQYAQYPCPSSWNSAPPPPPAGDGGGDGACGGYASFDANNYPQY